MFGINPAQRRYNQRVLALSVAYAALLFGAVWLFRAERPAGPAAYLLALLPALPLIGIFAVMARYLVEEQDEYVRMVQVRKALIATGFMLTVTTCWGFLQSFQLAPHVDFYWAAVLWFAGLGLGSCAETLRR